jgi:acyl carrier protein
LGPDSLETIEVVMAVEDVFGTERPQEEIERMVRRFRTKKELFDYLEKHRKGRGLN